MDAGALILSALSAGALAAAQETAGQVLKDAYQGLKTLVQEKLQGKPRAKTLLKEHAKDPDTWEKPLHKALEETGALEDEAIQRAAEQVLMELRLAQAAASSAPGKYAVQVHGAVKGMVTGDHTRVTMHIS